MSETRAPAPTLTARQPRAVHSALTVLEAVAHLGAGATAREISQELGLPRATVYRLLNLRYGERFQAQTMDQVKPLPSGLLGPVRVEITPSR